MYFLIELDRKGNNDLVYYGDTNKDFHKYLEDLTEYKDAWGSCSDISTLSPVCQISSVNISCGYYNAHTPSEYVVMEEMENSINVTIKIMEDGLKKKEQFKYTKREYNYRKTYEDYEYIYTSAFRSLWESDDKEEENETLYIMWSKDGKEYDREYIGNNLGSLWVQFFIDHPDICYNDIIDYDEYRDEDIDVI